VQGTWDAYDSLAGAVGADLRAARREPGCKPGTGRLGDPALPTSPETRYCSVGSTTSSWRDLGLRRGLAREIHPDPIESARGRQELCEDIV